MNDFNKNREFLKDSIRKSINFRNSDQSRGIPMPPWQEATSPDATAISLPSFDTWRASIDHKDLIQAIGDRKSRRRFSNEFLTMNELAFLLWATQGQRNSGKGQPQFRTVPSAGARHSFETYLFINRVKTLPAGLYRFLPLSNELVLEYETDERFKNDLSKAVFGQRFVADGAVVFVWTTVPYRMEWRYLESAYRVILIDAGHVCQNLYLACEAIGAGTCAIGAYDQEAMDALLKVDGMNQFTVYMAPVGKYAE
jgi:SagB-type dehydrogenase family enzyme